MRAPYADIPYCYKVAKLQSCKMASCTVAKWQSGKHAHKSPLCVTLFFGVFEKKQYLCIVITILSK